MAAHGENREKPAALLKEAPGFVGNRLQFALLREALHCVKEGIATAETVDFICKYGIGRSSASPAPWKQPTLAVSTYSTTFQPI